MKSVAGKVAVVTGAASGIGKAMAERFAREGMKLVLADVEEKPLVEVRDALVKGGAQAVAVRTDVSKPEQVDDLARRTIEAFGAAHVVCNNAGIGAGGFMWQIPVSDWNWILNVNLLGVVHGIRAFVPGMIAQGEGHVVNTASVAGLITGPGMGPYCATKHAVVAMSECLFNDLKVATGGKVKVSVLCPAWVKTRIAESERNRPDSAPRGPDGPQEEMMRGMIRSAVESGIPPEVVANKVLDAVMREKFWILTHSKMKASIEKRMRGILEDRDPELELPGGSSNT